MTSSSIIRAAKRLIQNGWTQVALAQDENGRTVHPCNPSACKFCINGAMLKCTPNAFDKKTYHFLELATLQITSGKHDVPHILNDSNSYNCIMRMFDIAIELAEKSFMETGCEAVSA